MSSSSSEHSNDVPDQPVVLCHGLLGFDEISVERFGEVHYFRGIREDLEELGCDVHVTKVTSRAGIPTRAEQLKKQFDGIPSPFHIIAHSMGGLDARYFISRMDGEKRVASLTTIGTPHRGTSLADAGLNRTIAGRNLSDIIPFDLETIEHLTRSHIQETFNPNTPNSSNVAYYSYGGTKPRNEMFPPLQYTERLINREEGENDGLVSVASARWGTYVRTLDADHLDEVNWGPSFDAKPVYRKIVRRIS